MSKYRLIMEDYIGAWNDANVDGILKHYSDGIIYRDMALGEEFNLETVRPWLSEVFKTIPDLKFIVTSLCE